jgi:predicted methyltransferase
MGIDFRACLYALSDVIINRPPPLRLFDQIFMKLPDMLLQAELISRWFKDNDVVFVGDGDAIALSLVHLGAQQLLPSMPKHVTVLDFDERVVNSINHFAGHSELKALVHSELYNVADQCQKGTGVNTTASTRIPHGEGATMAPAYAPSWGVASRP